MAEPASDTKAETLAKETEKKKRKEPSVAPLPEGVPGPFQMPDHEAKCRVMKPLFMTFGADYHRCNECHQPIHAMHTRFTCKHCDYDACYKCYTSDPARAAAVPKKYPRRKSPHHVHSMFFLPTNGIVCGCTEKECSEQNKYRLFYQCFVCDKTMCARKFNAPDNDALINDDVAPSETETGMLAGSELRQSEFRVSIGSYMTLQ